MPAPVSAPLIPVRAAGGTEGAGGGMAGSCFPPGCRTSRALPLRGRRCTQSPSAGKRENNRAKGEGRGRAAGGERSAAQRRGAEAGGRRSQSAGLPALQEMRRGLGGCEGCSRGPVPLRTATGCAASTAKSPILLLAR